MPTLYDRLSANEYTDRKKVLNEVVYRSPGSVGPFTIVSHIPFLYESNEDLRFNKVSTLIVERIKPHIRGPGSRVLSLEQNWPRLAGNLHSFGQSDRDVIGQIAHDADTILLDILAQYPEYFLFGCHSQIVLVENHNLFDKNEFYVSEHLEKCRMLMGWLDVLLRKSVLVIRDCVAQCIRDADKELEEIGYPDMGGIITRFRRQAKNVHPQRYDATFNTDFYDLDITGPEGIGHTKYFRLKWSRSNQFWTYTFFESSANSPALSPPADKDRDEMPYLPLALQSEAIKVNYCDRSSLGYYLALILSFANSASIVNSPALNEIMGTHLGDSQFPGKLLGGGALCLLATRNFNSFGFLA